MSDPYSVGLATVANGATAVTGTDTFWVGKVRKNDMFFVPAQGLQARVTADPTDNDALTITAWAGTSLVDAAYEIIPASDTTTSAARLRDLLAQMSVIEANGRGLFYRFSDSVTDADPGSGYLRLNNPTIGSATAAYIDNLDANGATVSAEIDTWDDSSSLTKGRLWLRSITDASLFHSFRVTGSVVDGAGYRKLTVAYVGGSGSFAAAGELMAFFVPNGDTGDGYVTDDTVADPSELTALEGEAAGYLVFVTDLQTDFGAYSGRSGVVRLIAGPDWEVVALYTGTKGDTGDQGEKGWSPRLVIVSDGARRVWQLSGYVGGEGAAPTANVGDYLKGDGTFTATIGDAADVRGPGGTGTVGEIVAGDGIAVDNTDPTAPVISSTVPPTDTTGIEANIAAMAFEIADLKGSRMNMAGGIADTYDSETDVDTATSTNEAYDAAGDLYAPSTSWNGGTFLMHADGTNGSSSFPDAIGSVALASTGTLVDTSQSKFGGASAAFTSTSYILADGSAGFTFGTGDFTIDFWVRPLVTTGMYIYDGRTASSQIVPTIRTNSSAMLVYFVNGSDRITGTTPLATGTWYHVALTRASGVTRMFLNGVQEGASWTDASNYIGNTSRPAIGTVGDALGNSAGLNGYMDELRVSKGTAQWTSTFTPPASAYAATVNNMTLVSNAFTSTAVPGTARIAIFVDPQVAITINTDLTAEVSRDGGTTWTAATLALVSSPVGTVEQYEDAEIDISAQPSGTSMKYRVKTLNNKDIDVTGVVFQWR